ncbi:MAG: DUF362 domain-containing protein, partial [Candidatus Thorarchaeota archaeon]
PGHVHLQEFGKVVKEAVREAGGIPFIMDSPGAGISYSQGGMKRVYRETGLLELSERTNIELNWDFSTTEVSFGEGELMKRFEVTKPVIDADVIIAMPKLKTHTFTRFTGATKILFGVIPGLVKVSYHHKLPEAERFSDMLLDVISYIKPTLFIMDGILGLEGLGPAFHGKPREIGILLSSVNPVALDVAACQVVRIDPLEVPPLRMAKKREWWDGRLESVEIVGCSIDDIAIADYDVPDIRSGTLDQRNMSFVERTLLPIVQNAVTPDPIPNKNLCTGCGTCVRSCPEQTITLEKGLAIVDHSKCIRCYCCHELCPEAAVDLRLSWTGRFLRRTGMVGRKS